MVHLFRRLAHHCWLTIAAVVILVAIAISVIRGAFIYANDYRNPLTQWILGSSASQVHINGLSARLVNFRPVLVLKQVQYQPKGNESFRLRSESVLVGLDLWDSIKRWTLVFQDVQLEGVDLTIPWMTPVKTDTSSVASQQIPQIFSELFLKKLDHFQIQQAQIHFLLPRKKQHTVYIDSMRWSNQVLTHRGEGTAYLPIAGAERSRIHFAIQFQGDRNRVDLLNMPGQFYASAEHLELSHVGDVVHSPVLKKLKTDLNFQVWGDFGGHRSSLWQLYWQPSQLDWSDTQDHVHQLKIEQGALILRQHADYYQLDSDQLSLVTDHHSWGAIQLQGVLQNDQLSGYLNQLPLAQSLPLLSLLPTLEQHRLPVVQQGSLQDIQFHYRLDQPRFDYQASLHHLVSTATGAIPGVDGLDAKISGDQQGLDFSLQMQQGEVRFDGTFEKNWPVDLLTAQGHVDWQSQLSIGFDQFRMDSPLLQVNAQARLDWLAQQSLPWLSLYGEVQLPDAGNAYRFYPHPVMPDKVADYLKQAIQGGQAKNAKILWYGALHQYPYRQHDGIFQAYVPLTKTTFKFQPDWSALHDMQLDLLFQNDSLHMQSHQAYLGDAPVANIQADIAQLNGRRPLTVDATIKSPAGAVHQYLEGTPISGLANTMKTLPISQGTLSGRLYLNIPLNGEAVAVNGRVNFEQNQVRMPAIGLQLDQVTGQLAFRQAELTAWGLQGYWKGHPIAFSFETQQLPDHYQVGIDLNGLWNMRQLRKSLGQPRWLDPVDGQLNWQGRINIKLQEADQFSYNAKFESNLKQLNVNLPKPLAKSGDQAWPTRLYVSGNATQGDGFVGIQDRVFDRFQYSTQHQFAFQSMRLNIGDATSLRNLARQLPSSGLSVGVDLPDLELQPWLKQALTWVSPSVAVKSSASPALSLPMLKLDSVDLNVNRLMAYQQPIDQLKLSYRSVGHIWQASSPQLQGQFVQPSKVSLQSPWKLNVQRADLPKLDLDALKQTFLEFYPESPKSSSSVAKGNAAGGTDIPALQIDCQSCTLGRFQIGSLSAWFPFESHQLHDGYIRIRGAGDFKFDSQLNWNQPGQPGLSATTGTFSTKNTGDLLKSLGFGSSVEQSPLKGAFQLNWHDAIYHFDKSSLSGNISWKAGEGVLTELSDKGTRLFTLASLDTIRRRLMLDFRDIFDKGLYFNSAQAKVTIHNGVINNDDFVMDGVAGNIKGHGQANLNTEQLDYNVSFAPKLTSSLPVLTAFAVTPVTGVAVLALSKLLEPAIEVISQVDFHIKGSFDHPELVEEGREKKKIKIPKNLRQGKHK
ncbi:YhdP family protein [Celerinatantimonas sp. YJH-8]|uniref:YhdP family protein n=1 Tax=Celerinatantimonas sp. YJH-8 TaxID=3228714 RepID=UPI0038C18BC8